MTSYPKYPYYSHETVCEEKPVAFPPQHQVQQPGLEYLMNPRPIFENPNYVGSNKLRGKAALITGGDSGIGRAVAIGFAKEGADAAYHGEKRLIDYSASEGAIVTFTRSLALSLADQGIRVNGVAPGPIWTPFIPSTFPAQLVKSFGTDSPMKRAGQPFELAPTYIYLASDDSNYVTGETLHFTC